MQTQIQQNCHTLQTYTTGVGVVVSLRTGVRVEYATTASEPVPITGIVIGASLIIVITCVSPAPHHPGAPRVDVVLQVTVPVVRHHDPSQPAVQRQVRRLVGHQQQQTLGLRSPTHRVLQQKDRRVIIPLIYKRATVNAVVLISRTSGQKLLTWLLITSTFPHGEQLFLQLSLHTTPDPPA